MKKFLVVGLIVAVLAAGIAIPAPVSAWPVPEEGGNTTAPTAADRGLGPILIGMETSTLFPTRTHTYTGVAAFLIPIDIACMEDIEAIDVNGAWSLKVNYGDPNTVDENDSGNLIMNLTDPRERLSGDINAAVSYSLGQLGISGAEGLYLVAFGFNDTYVPQKGTAITGIYDGLLITNFTAVVNALSLILGGVSSESPAEGFVGGVVIPVGPLLKLLLPLLPSLEPMLPMLSRIAGLLDNLIPMPDVMMLMPDPVFAKVASMLGLF